MMFPLRRASLDYDTLYAGRWVLGKIIAYLNFSFTLSMSGFF
jgi:hypothetical protein